MHGIDCYCCYCLLLFVVVYWVVYFEQFKGLTFSQMGFTMVTSSHRHRHGPNCHNQVPQITVVAVNIRGIFYHPNEKPNDLHLSSWPNSWYSFSRLSQRALHTIQLLSHVVAMEIMTSFFERCFFDPRSKESGLVCSKHNAIWLQIRIQICLA